MTTALQIINRAAELVGYKDQDETLSGNDAASFLASLNSMVDAWALDSLMVYAQTELVQSVSGNPVSIGEGATLDTPRPIRIPAGGFFRIGGTDYGFRMVSREEYAEKTRKSTTRAWPDFCYYEADAPTGNLYFYPALSGAAELHLPVERRLTAFASLATAYNLLPGNRLALEYSLAEELFPSRVSPQIARKAINARRAIRMVNVRVPELIDERVVALQSPLRPA